MSVETLQGTQEYVTNQSCIISDIRVTQRNTTKYVSIVMNATPAFTEANVIYKENRKNS